MLRPRSPQASFYGSYLYDKIIPADHLLRKINQVVDFSFVNDLVKDKYTPDFGRPAEDPEFMLKLCLLQYLYGDSDRQVIENTRLNLAYKYFLGLAIDEEVPDDTTISYFRAQRLGEAKFRQVFEKIVKQCKDKGLVKGKRQIIDSTHIVADMAVTSLTGLIKMCRRNVLKTIHQQKPDIADKLGLKELLVTKQDKFCRKEDNLEEEIEQAEKLLDGVTQKLKEKQIAVTPQLQKELALLEKAVADRADGAENRLVSPVDPSARSGNKTHKHWVGYKGHLIVEEDTEIITAVETTPGNKDDGSQLKPLLQQQEQHLDIKPAELSGDKGYDSGANLEYLADKGITGNISLSTKINTHGEDLFTRNEFVYDAVKDVVICPAGCVASHAKRDFIHTDDQKRSGWMYQFSRKNCSVCELRLLCVSSKSKVYGRAVHISIYEPLFQQMRQRMESEEGKQAYHERYKIEHKIADLARYCGMRRCRYRGLTRAGVHSFLAATVSNIKRMARLVCPRTGKACPILVVAPQNPVAAS
jgi:transposase